MSSFRNAIRFFALAIALTLPVTASAANFEVKALIDHDANSNSVALPDCVVLTPGGVVSGINTILTTAGTVNGGLASVTAVTRQTCVNSALNQFSSPVPVDGGWNVGVSSIGDLLIESHLGSGIITMDNVRTPRFVFTTTSGIFADALLTPWSWGGGDILMTHAARDRAVATRPLRVITLDGSAVDWDGVPLLANGTANAPAWRFISATAYAGANDLYFKFQIHTNSAAPTAHDDNYALAALGGSLTINEPGLRSNDDPNGQPITASIIDTPQHGTITPNGNGGFTYTNDGALVPQDQFHYVDIGTPLVSNIATVTIDLPGSHPYTFTSADHVTFIAGQFNTFQVVVTGKPTPALSETGALPAGVIFTDNGNGTGTLSGTPAANTVGTYPIVFNAEKNKPHQSSQNFTLTVTCSSMTVNNPSVTTGTVGTPFSQTFTQSGGAAPITWSKSGALPAGLTFNTVSGVLSGTPTQGGTFPITVTATDASGCTATGPTYTLIIICNSITVTNPVVNTGTVNVAFSQTFTQVGGVGATTFSLASGTLPAGLTLNPSTGVLSGTPTQKGTFPIVVRATDSNGCANNGPTYNLTIGCQVITVTNPATNTGTVNVAFSQTFSAGNAIAPVTFSLNSGTLPAGLTLSAGGVLSGTPTQTGSFPITVKATDANGCFGISATYTLTIGCQVITVTNPATNTGTVNVAFSQTFTAANVIAPVTFSLNSGTLPTGVTLSSAGVLSGTPTQTGSFPITVKATDANGCFGVGATYTLTIGCQVITVNNPATTTGTVNIAFSQNFTATNAIGAVTFTTASTLPAGITLATNGTLSGTPTQSGTFPIVVTATDANGCTGTGTTYTLVIGCQTITVTNPATTTGTVNVAFSQTFTASNTIGAVTFTTASTLPAGLSLSTGGVLSGTPTQTGSFPIVVTATDANGCSGSGATYTLVIGCQTITVTNPATNTGTVNAAFSQTFTASNTIGAVTFTTASTQPAGLALSTGGVLSGTPTQNGSFPIVVTATDANGCTGSGATYTLTIGCQVITVTNPATTTGTVNTAFSQTFTAGNTVGAVTFTLNSGTLPTGLSLSTGGVLSGTPTQSGSFPITVKATDANGCFGVGATYTLVIGCQTITVTNPVNNTGTINVPFSETFTAGNTIGAVTFTLNSGTLPTGLSLSTGGILSGTPTQPGSFPITVKATDANGCFGVSATYTISIACQTITVGNPTSNSNAAGTPLVAANFTFTQTGGIGTTNFTTASTLPTGVTLSTGGVLQGTPTQGGSFPITVTATDSNGCTGLSSGYILTITCPVITVTNPGVNTGTVDAAFSQTFTQSGGQGTITWSVSGALPNGITLSTSSGVLSGTPTQPGSFPITVTATDQNGCTGTGATYILTIACQTITVTNPGVTTGTVDAPFSQTFTQSGVGTHTPATFTINTGTLPSGLSLSTAGVLSGTPGQPGSFPITVKVTDVNGCTGIGATYTLNIACQTITVTNPGVTTGTVDAAFSQTFTQTGVGTHTPATFTINSGTLPSGLTLSSAGVLSGTPGQPGSFPITVKVTDVNGCSGIGATYNLNIACQTITVTNPGVTTGTAGQAFSQTFTQTGVGTHTPATFTTASTLPTGFSLSTAGVLAGTTTQHGSFPIVVTVTDSNGCTGTGSTYTLVIACNTITVTNPVNTTGTVASPFSETFTSSGTLGTPSYTTASTLPTGLTLHSSTGVLDGTPTQSGLFPIVVTVTDSNGCTGSGATYNLNIACNVITVTNPGVNTGTAGVAFSQTFTQTGGNGTITWSEVGALPSGITLSSSTGTLFGTTSQVGSFPITVTATDSNGCTGNSSYTLTINCQTITVTNPGQTSVQAGVALDVVFTATGILGTATWTETGALPTGITLVSGTGHLQGTTTQIGSFPITVKATDTNGCFGTSSYTLTVTCPVITVSRSGGGSFPAGVFNTAYTGQSVTASPASTYTFAVTSGALPTGLTLASGGAISGTPTATGVFSFTITATDTVSLCTGSQAFSISIAPSALNDAYGASPPALVDNTQFVITGGTTTSPATPFVSSATNLIANDLPSGGVTATPGTFATTGGGSVTIAADGTFIYTPGVHAAAITSDTFTYTVISNGVTSAPATVTLTLANRVWYVKNNSAAGGDGRSHFPFDTLAEAQTASAAGDIIFVYNGDNTTLGQTAGITLKANQQLIGEGVALVVNTATLKAAGSSPKITNVAATSDAITLANSGNNTVKGVTVTGATRDGITGINSGTFTGDTLVVQNNVTNGIVLNNSAVVTITNSTISGNGIGLQIIGGGAAVAVDNTNSITANAGQRSVSITQRISTGAITIGATIVDNGTGISVTSPVSGTPIVNFTGTQTLTTTTNQAVTLTGNTGTTINFSGVLNITTTTGTAFNATGGGTLNVTGTANVTTGAATTGVNINGVTAGASGVIFSSVNTTGATTGVSFTSLGNGNVAINGGTISGGTTGLSLSTLGTSAVSLVSVTFTGSTTAISGTNFGTIGVAGGTVNVSGVTALNLTTGNLNGTFANLSSTGGTNGVVLNGVGGTGWTANAGSLVGASGAGFKVDGGNANITYAGSITTTTGSFLVDIGATTGRSGGTITFSTGTLGGAGTLAGSGIRIQNSTGTNTFTFSGTQTLGTSGSRMAATAVSLTGNATGTTFNFNGTMSIFTTGATAFTATGPTGGTINFSGADSIDAATGSALVLNGVNLGSGTLSNVTSTGGVNGISLTTVTGGTLTISAGALSGSSGATFLINAGSPTVSYAGTITNSAASQRVVDIQNATGGTTTLSGAISNSGTAAGVFLNSNTGATISISNNMTLSTGSLPAFTATGGGTVNVTGSTNNLTTTSGKGINWSGDTSGSTVTFNNVTSTTGDAVTVASSGATNFTMNDIQSTSGTAVTISTATGDFSFHKINANGGSKGISVTSLTGGGSFTVTGTGGSGLCDATHIGVSDCAGGTIQNISTRGAEFTTTAQISLTNMYFKTAATTLGSVGGCKTAVVTGTTTCNAPIYINGSTNGATLNRIFIDGSVQMGIAGTGMAGMTLTNTEVQNTTSAANQAAVTLINNTGTIGITSLNLHNNDSGGTGMLFVENDSGTMTLNVTSSTFNKGTSLSGGINAASYSTANMTVNIQTSTFGDAVAGNGLFSNGVTIGQNGTSMNATINGSSFTNTNGISMAGTTGALTYSVTNNNPIQNRTNGSNGITVGKTAGSGTATGTLSGNNITKATCGGGCAGIRINAFGAGGTTNQTITGNTISGVDSDGILFAIGQGATNSTFVIQTNTISSPAAGNDGFAINAVSGTSGGDNPCSVFTVGGAGALANPISGAWRSVSADGFRMNFDETLGNIKINGFVSGSIPSYIAGNNPSITAAQVLIQGAVSGGTTCP